MKLNKLTITSKTGHFGKFLGYDNRYTYNSPPPSTIIGMLQTIYDRKIDNFIFGYLFESDTKFKDTITIHKRSNEGRFIKNKEYQSDAKFIEMHYNCKLKIYTSITQNIKMNYMLCMGKAENIARLHFPIQKVKLVNKKGQGFNQYTTKDIGTGNIKSYNMKSYYVPKFNSYDHQVELLRFNKVFDYNKNYDEEEQQNIFLWEIKDGKVKAFD